jgi:hypothetical protein
MNFCRFPVHWAPPRGRATRFAFSALALAGAFLYAAVSQGAVYFVDAARPDDSGQGTNWGTAKRTIPAAIAASAAGDTILVKYGTYAVPAPIEIATDRKLSSDDGTHVSFETARPDSAQCILAGANLTRLFTISSSAVTTATSVRGFEFVNGNATLNGSDPNNGYGGGIYILGNADPVIERCWINQCVAGAQYNGRGGGIACDGAGTNPLILNCRITDNVAAEVWYGYGGGIYCGAGTSPTIRGNWIEGNTASILRVGQGGGICCELATSLIELNTIVSNQAASIQGAGGDGGGAYLYYGPCEFRYNVVSGNLAAVHAGHQGSGGGLRIWNAPHNIHDNDIHDNIASVSGPGYGGGIHASMNNGTILNNRIAGNFASTSNTGTWDVRIGYGGGITMTGNSTIARGNLFFSNTASKYGDGYGGAIYFVQNQTIERNVIAWNVASEQGAGYGGGTWSYNCWGACPIRNNTFYRNANQATSAGPGNGSGICHSSGGAPTIEGNVFAFHDRPGSDMIGIWSGVAITIRYNSFFGNPGGDYNANVTSLDEPAKNSGALEGATALNAPGRRERTDVDPRFSDPENGDFSLQGDSPLIEAANPSTPVPEDGGWRADIGAIEYTGTATSRSVSGPGELLFGGQVRAKVNLTAAGSLTALEVTVHPGEPHEGAPEGVRRWYEMIPTGADAIYDLTLSYLDEELNGLDEAGLVLWRWNGSGWDGPMVPSARNTQEDWMTVSDQTGFGIWVLAVEEPSSSVEDHEAGDLDLGASRGGFAEGIPNPFPPCGTVQFICTRPGPVELSIIGADGRRRRLLVRGEFAAGEHGAMWDGRDDGGRLLSPGVYFLRLDEGGHVASRRVTVLR